MPFSKVVSIALLIGAIGIQSVTEAQVFPKPEISVERLYSYPLINGRSPSAPSMSPDGSKIAFGWNQTGERKLDLWVMDYPSGKKRVIVEADKILDLPTQDDRRTELEKTESRVYDGGIGGARWSPNGDELMFSYKGRTWLVSPDGKNLRPIVDGSLPYGGFQYSRDGKSFYLTSGSNLYRMDRATGSIKQLTFLNTPRQSVGDYIVSPDGKWIALVWSDSSKSGSHVMMDFSKDRATVVNIQRMWNGDLSINDQIGVIPASGGVINFVTGFPRYMWLKGFEWAPDSSKFAVGYITEDFQEFALATVEPAKAVKREILKEKAPKNYINDWRYIDWTRDSKSILLGTDQEDGKFINRSIFKLSEDGTQRTAVYKENHDVGSFARPEDSDRIIATTAGKSPLSAEITIIEPDGKRKVHEVIPGGYSVPKAFNWADLPLFSKDGKRIATMASSRTINAELYGVEPEIKRLTQSQLPEFAKIKWAKFQPVSFPGPEGATIHGILITNPNMDPNKKYPAILSNIYADSGKAAWAGYAENYAAMNLDMVVLCVDFRSSWGQGGDFNSGYYRKMGLIDADEAVAAKKFLTALPYVRNDRVGLWGWSYGGFLTCMTLLTKPGEFDTGVAVASVTDWKSYNEWYTRRRIGLVSTDKEAFDKNSPITYASGLQDNLLLVHGILDDNVLFQDTARLAQRLIENGKYFDMLAYPRDDHSIGQDKSRPHVFSSILRYLYMKLHRP